MSEPRFESALDARGDLRDGTGLSVEMHEITDRGMIDLRGSLSDRKFAAAAKKVLGLELPTTPRTSVEKGGIYALWLSIDQWLICCPRSKTADLLGKLQKPLSGVHALAVDLSDARTIIRLQGETVRETLMKGAPVDLLGAEFVKGTVRRLRFGEIAAMVHLVDDNPDVIDLYVFRSYADFAWDWLAETGRKPATIKLFGCQEIIAS